MTLTLSRQETNGPVEGAFSAGFITFTHINESSFGTTTKNHAHSSMLADFHKAHKHICTHTHPLTHTHIHTPTHPHPHWSTNCLCLCEKYNVVVVVAYSSLVRIFGESLTIPSLTALLFFPFLLFEAEISSCTLIPLFMQRSVHSGSAN